MGFLEIGKLAKDISAYVNTRRQLVEIELVSRKKQIAPLIVAALVGLFFVAFFFLALTFLLGGLFKYWGFELLISLGLGFLSVSGLFLVIMLFALLAAKRQGNSN